MAEQELPPELVTLAEALGMSPEQAQTAVQATLPLLADQGFRERLVEALTEMTRKPGQPDG